MFTQVLQELLRFDTVILHRHQHPDGDALGSQIGLKHLILENLPGKKVYCVGDGAGRYDFMADSVMDDIPDRMYADALAVILDTSAPHLISDGRYTLARRTVRLDHHLFVEKIADTEVQDSSFESCCGLITRMAMELGWKLNLTAATALYTGMVTDSGRFRYDSTSSGTFALASFLMTQPIDTASLYRNLYADDLDRVRAKGYFLQKITLSPGGVAYIYTTRQELEELQADIFSVSRGMVGTMSDIRGVDIWVNFTESDRGVLCELRSSVYNINPIAVKYGGGGHAKASGATVEDRQAAMAMLHDLELLLGENL